MAKKPVKMICAIGSMAGGKTSGKKPTVKKPAVKKPYTQVKLDKARNTISCENKDVFLVSNYLSKSLQDLRDEIDDLITKHGSDAMYYLEIEVAREWYDEYHIEIEQNITTERQETDAEVTVRLDKNADVRVARAATKKAAKDADEQAERAELARLQAKFGGE